MNEVAWQEFNKNGEIVTSRDNQAQSPFVRPYGCKWKVNQKRGDNSRRKTPRNAERK